MKYQKALLCITLAGTLIFSRSIALAVFTVLTMAGAFLLQAVANYIVFRELTWGSSKAVLSYFLTELALHCALVLICMAIAIILKNNVTVFNRQRRL